MGMRPLGARALKSAIDTLRPWLLESSVLDLFSGQGRFGLSALEEVARSVTFVEKDARMVDLLRKNCLRYPERATVIHQDAFQFLGTQNHKFDIIFADPPFALWNEKFSKTLFQNVAQVVKEGSIFLVKHPRRVVACTSFQGFTFWKSSDFGESQLIYFTYGKTENHVVTKTP